MDHQTATTSQAVERYLLGELAGGELDEFEEHYFACQECGEAVRLGTLLAVNGRDLVEARALRPSVPGRVTEIRPRPGRRAWNWQRDIATVAAGVLLAVTGFQNLVTIPSLKAPRAVMRTTLHARSRGQAPAVKTSSGSDSVLVLELDTNQPLPSYRVDVVESGKTISSIPEAPAQEGAIEIELPRGLASGNYEVLVRGSADGQEAASYPFQLGK